MKEMEVQLHLRWIDGSAGEKAAAPAIEQATMIVRNIPWLLERERLRFDVLSKSDVHFWRLTFQKKRVRTPYLELRPPVFGGGSPFRCSRVSGGTLQQKASFADVRIRRRRLSR